MRARGLNHHTHESTELGAVPELSRGEAVELSPFEDVALAEDSVQDLWFAPVDELSLECPHIFHSLGDVIAGDVESRRPTRHTTGATTLGTTERFTPCRPRSRW